MRTRRTVRGRVAVLGTLVLAGWALLTATGFDLVLSWRLDQQVEDALRVRAEAASSTVVVKGGRVTGVRESATDGALDSSTWVYAGRTALERPTLRPELQRVADGLAGTDRRLTDRSDHRFFVLPVRSGGRQIGTVVVALDLDPYEHTRAIVVIGSLVVVAVLLLGAYPVLRIAVARALRPVGTMTAQAARWGAHDTGRRFGPQSTEELTTLAASLDALLERLAALIRHERHLSAELSHELRTPLARLLAEVDLLLEHAPDGVRADLLRIREDGDAMVAIIDTLMAAARGELGGAPGHTDLAEVLAATGAEVAAAGVEVDVEPTELGVGVDPDVVTRTLAPIAANARRHAATRVTIQARRDGPAVVIAVANDGPPVPADERDRLFEPGYRAARDDGHDGAGLGLALARRLARAADGDVTVAEDTGGGATFLVRLPAG